jgi:CubicO group peptidase (beta-lactamase class C family)
MKKRFKLIVTAIILVTVIIAGLILFLPSESQEKADKKVFKPAAFLAFQSHWADSLVKHMPVHQLIQQLIIVEGDVDSVKANYGGYIFEKVSHDSLFVAFITDSCSTIPFAGAKNRWQLMNETLSACHIMASPGWLRIQADSIVNRAENQLNLNTLWDEADFTKYNIGYIAPVTERTNANALFTHDSINSRQMIPVGIVGGGMDTVMLDKYKEFLDSICHLNRVMLIFNPAPWVEQTGVDRVKITVKLSEFLLENKMFNGLLVADVSHPTGKILPDTLFRHAWNHGADMLKLNHSQVTSFETFMRQLLTTGEITEEQLRTRVHRILLAKAWLGLNQIKSGVFQKQNHDVNTQRLFYNVAEQSVTVLKSEVGLLPFPLKDKPDIRLVDITGDCPGYVTNAMSFYESFKPGINTASHLNILYFKAGGKNRINTTEYQSLLKSKNSVLIFNGTPTPEDTVLFDACNTVIVAYGNTDIELKAAVQIVFGGMAAYGKLPYSLSSRISKNTGIHTPQTRLGFAEPLAVGMHPDSLANLSTIANQGINAGAYPGCQVLAVKDGRIIWDKSYGHTDYSRRTPVTSETIYDLASVTKIAATTMLAMKLYETGKLDLDAPLSRYLPDTLSRHLYNRRSTLADITWRELLTHRSGLPAGINVYKFMRYTDTLYGRFDKYYCDRRDDSLFTVEVARDYYLENLQLDSIWRMLHLITPSASKEYVYSDINANLLYILMQRILRQSEPEPPRRKRPIQPAERWNAAVYETKLQEFFYKPLRMKRTGFLPLRYYNENEIAPTEEDRYWRKQTLRGYVHDPTAAVFGGIAGSAGLFSTSRDLATMYQMMLFDGSYGGKQYLKPETIAEFTRKQANGHRGLGFNKPVGDGAYGIPAAVSLKTYGHTGYTGNSIWVDPENKIIYILLSNRSHPKGDNPIIITMGIQGRLHEAIYSALMKPSGRQKHPA